MSLQFHNKAIAKPIGEPERAPVELLNVNEVADILGISPRTVYRLAQQGQMPRPVKLGTSLVRWHRDALDIWLDRGCPRTEKGGAIQLPQAA